MKNNSSQLKIKTLRVKELQQELQKRGLAQTGKKAVLLKRLQNALNSSELNDNNIANSSPDKTIQTNTIVKKAIITYKPKSKYYMKTIQSLRRTIVTLKKEIRSIKFSLDQVCQTNIKQKTDKGAGKKSVKSKVANLLSGSSSIHNNSSMSNPNLKDNDSFNFQKTQNNNANTYKEKVLILADSHGRNLSNTLREKLPKHHTQCIFKPNALWENVVSDVEKLSMNYNKCDYIIICAGVNNALKGRKLPTETIFQSFDQLSHTNVLLLTIRLIKDRPVLNKFINEINGSLQLSATLYDNVTVINSNEFLNSSDFYKLGIHVNNTGKKKIIEALSQRIIFNKLSVSNDLQSENYINYDNLVKVFVTKQTTPSQQNDNADSELLRGSEGERGSKEELRPNGEDRQDEESNFESCSDGEDEDIMADETMVDDMLEFSPFFARNDDGVH